jgi:hypothetical protein
MKKIIFILIGLIFLTSCAPDESQFKSDVPVFEDRVIQPSGPQLGQPSGPPSEINLDVPFFPQAPDADWGMPWQEACEEAAVLLAYYYATDQSPTKEEFKANIQQLIDWQIENFGDYKHTNIEQTAKMLSEVFKYSSIQVFKDVNAEDLKKELAQGHVIVAPFAGRELQNPFYSGEGPLYHMMVIKGYDEEHFITNDVGTKRGENFIYPYETIMSAMHEWDDTDINLGQKKVIVIY